MESLSCSTHRFIAKGARLSPVKTMMAGLVISAVLSGCSAEGLRTGIFDSGEKLPPPAVTVTNAPADGLDALDRAEIARVVGGIDLDGPPASTVAQIPQTATYAIIEEVALDETAGPGCRRFSASLINRRGTRDFTGAVCPTPDGWRLLQPGETTIADVLPGVSEDGANANADKVSATTEDGNFIEAPAPTSTGPEVTSTSVPEIGSDLIDPGLFDAGVNLNPATANTD